jgi:hypothetical protein
MMNERIKELAKQAASEYNDANGICIPDDFVGKLTELIIRECLGDHKERIATRYQGSDYDRAVGYGMEIVYYDIVEKFGVE